MPRLLALLLLLPALALAACGDDGGGGGGTATAASAGGKAEAGAYPVTIRSQFGTATIKAAPKRVLTLDNQATDDALALGVVPVAMQQITYVKGGIQAWTKAALGRARVPLLNTDSELPYERIAALRPDLILAPHTFLLDRAAYARLSRIAPVVHFAKGPLADSWQDTTRRVGQALGRPRKAADLVARTEREIADARKRTPAFEGATVNIFNADPSGLYAINQTSDYALRLMAGLGLRLSPQVAKLKGEGGRAVISPERYDLLDSDLLLGTSGASPAVLSKLERDKLFQRLQAVRDGHYVSLPIGAATSMAFPSLLSVRYAVREVVPQLERAIRAKA